MTKENQLSEEYTQKVKATVHDGSFFRDAMQWYVFQYVRPSVDRNLMVVFSLVGLLCVYYLYEMIMASFPLVEEVPVIIREHDTSLYNPIIKKLKDNNDKDGLNADESVLKYLASNYVMERESFDFSQSDVKEVNRKFNVIKNNSSYLQYREFRELMNRSNPSSPIQFFGQDVYRAVEILSVNFIKNKSKTKFDLIKEYFSSQFSNGAEIRFKATLFSRDKDGNQVQDTKKYLVKIAFDFSGLDREEKSGVLGFSVKKYDLFEIK